MKPLSSSHHTSKLMHKNWRPSKGPIQATFANEHERQLANDRMNQLRRFSTAGRRGGNGSGLRHRNNQVDPRSHSQTSIRSSLEEEQNARRISAAEQDNKPARPLGRRSHLVKIMHLDALFDYALDYAIWHKECIQYLIVAVVRWWIETSIVGLKKTDEFSKFIVYFIAFLKIHRFI